MPSPGGNPVADQEYGAVPPVAVTVVATYATFTVPDGSEDGPLMDNGGATARV